MFNQPLSLWSLTVSIAANPTNQNMIGNSQKKAAKAQLSSSKVKNFVLRKRSSNPSLPHIPSAMKVTEKAVTTSSFKLHEPAMVKTIIL